MQLIGTLKARLRSSISISLLLRSVEFFDDVIFFLLRLVSNSLQQDIEYKCIHTFLNTGSQNMINK